MSLLPLLNPCSFDVVQPRRLKNDHQISTSRNFIKPASLPIAQATKTKSKFSFHCNKLEIISLMTTNSPYKMSYFRITLQRSAIGLPKRVQGVLMALGLRRRMKTVFHPVSPQVAGHIMKVKELISVSEVEKPLTQAELRKERQPDPGYYLERAVPR